ncbi:hypothetical protein [Hungatella hathewayi]|uniref:hypothetical protein n=1 Tax=Hungatella hathewayi TaxID=154046 RepID=UPI0035665919
MYEVRKTDKIDMIKRNCDESDVFREYLNENEKNIKEEIKKQKANRIYIFNE